MSAILGVIYKSFWKNPFMQKNIFAVLLLSIFAFALVSLPVSVFAGPYDPYPTPAWDCLRNMTPCDIPVQIQPDFFPEVNQSGLYTLSVIAVPSMPLMGEPVRFLTTGTMLNASCTSITYHGGTWTSEGHAVWYYLGLGAGYYTSDWNEGGNFRTDMSGTLIETYVFGSGDFDLVGEGKYFIACYNLTSEEYRIANTSFTLQYNPNRVDGALALTGTGVSNLVTAVIEPTVNIVLGLGFIGGVLIIISAIAFAFVVNFVPRKGISAKMSS
jgi:hypothetical protein